MEERYRFFDAHTVRFPHFEDIFRLVDCDLACDCNAAIEQFVLEVLPRFARDVRVEIPLKKQAKKNEFHCTITISHKPIRFVGLSSPSLTMYALMHIVSRKEKLIAALSEIGDCDYVIKHAAKKHDDASAGFSIILPENASFERTLAIQFRDDDVLFLDSHSLPVNFAMPFERMPNTRYRKNEELIRILRALSNQSPSFRSVLGRICYEEAISIAEKLRRSFGADVEKKLCIDNFREDKVFFEVVDACGDYGILPWLHKKCYISLMTGNLHDAQSDVLLAYATDMKGTPEIVEEKFRRICTPSQGGEDAANISVQWAMRTLGGLIREFAANGVMLDWRRAILTPARTDQENVAVIHCSVPFHGNPEYSGVNSPSTRERESAANVLEKFSLHNMLFAFYLWKRPNFGRYVGVRMSDCPIEYANLKVAVPHSANESNRSQAMRRAKEALTLVRGSAHNSFETDSLDIGMTCLLGSRIEEKADVTEEEFRLLQELMSIFFVRIDRTSLLHPNKRQPQGNLLNFDLHFFIHAQPAIQLVDAPPAIVDQTEADLPIEISVQQPSKMRDEIQNCAQEICRIYGTHFPEVQKFFAQAVFPVLLQESSFEGLTPRTAMQSFAFFWEAFSKIIQLPKGSSISTRAIANVLSNASTILQRLQGLRTEDSQKAFAEYKKLSLEIGKSIRNLAIGQQYLLPASWSAGVAGGHAVFLLLKKVTKDELLVVIINKQENYPEDVQGHVSNFATKSAPGAVFRVPQSALLSGNSDVEELIFSFLLPGDFRQHDEGTKTKDYKQLFHDVNFDFLAPYAVPDALNKFSALFTRVQRCGNCVIKATDCAIIAMLFLSFPQEQRTSDNANLVFGITRAFSLFVDCILF
ncbi:MAG: hypothetical protein LBC42_03040, partial [Puniceicoccales bacterium]|nr:hypothetical protein [Puniceicoccales bacterium]